MIDKLKDGISHIKHVMSLIDDYRGLEDVIMRHRYNGYQDTRENMALIDIYNNATKELARCEAKRPTLTHIAFMIKGFIL